MNQLFSHHRDLLAGARAMVPWLLAVTPFGLVIGVSASNAQISTLAGWMTGPLIYGGSAQIAAIELLDAGAAPVAVIITALVINLRLVFYSAAIATHWRGTPWWWRLLGGYLLVDPSFVVGIDRYGQPSDRLRAHSHYLGAAVTLWVAWLAAIATGALAGAQLPPALHLEFVIPLFLVGQVVPKLRATTTRRAALTAAAVALLAFSAPMHLGVAVAIAAGIAAGLWPHHHHRRRRRRAGPTGHALVTEAYR
jgi:predicted branched-subunit amino acid permease